MSSKKPVVKARNRHAINPIMRKGGCHGKSRKAQRQADKQALRSQRAHPSADATARLAS